MDERRNAIFKQQLGKRYENATLAQMRNDPLQYEIIDKWIKKPTGFFVFLGRPGCGKTHLAAAMMNFLYPIALERNPHVEFFFYRQGALLEEFRSGYSKKWHDTSIRDKVYRCNLLALDDFGATRNNDWQHEVLDELIDYRSNERKLTIITSNLTFGEIAEKFHPRLRSRLEADENTILEDWETDFRVQQKEEDESWLAYNPK